MPITGDHTSLFVSLIVMSQKVQVWFLEYLAQVFSISSRVVADLTFSNPSGQIRIWEQLVFGSQNNMPDKTNRINSAIGCYKEAVQFSASFVMSLFANFD